MTNKYKKRHRLIATLFLLIFFPTLIPSNLFASNNGPAAPEATSFEPVDAKDMVNLATGDMSYVLPLLNVPSPEGGYPLALSNHAGIAMDQEASWVGLGWGLNPGAINRSVSGVPDDWYRSSIANIYYDGGGENTTYTGSIGVGWQKGTYSVGLYASYSENKTFGGSTSYSTNVGLYGSAGIVNGSIGTDGASIGLSFDNKSNDSVNFGVNQSFENGSTGISVSASSHSDLNVGPNSSVGFSLNSSQGFSSSIAGRNIKISGNTPKGTMSTSECGFDVSIPVYMVNVGFGYNKIRYWQYEHNLQNYNGLLYAGDLKPFRDESTLFNHVSFDSYDSLYKFDSDGQMDNDNLSFISYDNYSVSGQGISGTITPLIYEPGTLINTRKNYIANNYDVEYLNSVNNTFTKKINNDLNDIHFYFDNENSSYLKIPSSNWSLIWSPSLLPEEIPAPNSKIDPSNSLLFDQNTKTTIDGVSYSGYDTATKRKRTGTYIETFTNEEINNNSSLIIKPENYDRTKAPVNGIGAFRITAQDGKTYHYSIPVYQHEMFTKNTDVKSDFNNRYNENIQWNPYATHWLLTAITGPDYVDANFDNKVGNEDYGYWTAFDYGKWSDGFAWTTQVKSNESTKFHEWGVKEVYYLDKIKTRTHTALFIKELRDDDFSYSYQIGANYNNMDVKQQRSLGYEIGKDGKRFFVGIFNNTVEKYSNQNGAWYNHYAIGEFGQYIKVNQHKSLRLKEILLLKNDDAIISKSNPNAIVSNFLGQIRLHEKIFTYRADGNSNNIVEIDADSHARTWYGEFYNNIYDTGDVTSLLKSRAFKTINFNYSYQLAKKSPNTPSLSGRLSLESVDFLGKNSTQVIPPYKFGYVNNVNYDATKEDNWGYYEGQPDAWSLNKVTTPTGAEINIAYESDDIDKEAVLSKRVFNGGLQFSYSNYNGKLRIKVENEYGTSKINFQDYFQSGTQTKLDLWNCYNHEYYDFGCKIRKGSVDVNSDVTVISASPSTLVLETNMSSCYDSNSGLSWMFSRVFGLENHVNMTREFKKRGEWSTHDGGCINVTDRTVLLYSLFSSKTSLTEAQKNGGGIRVKEINIAENSLVKKRAKYFYNIPGFNENKTDINYKSSGITSFVPQKYFKEVKYRSELPSPEVMYEYVTVKNYSSNNELDYFEQYNFEVLKQDTSTSDDNLTLANNLEIEKVQTDVWNSNVNYSRYTIKDLTSNIGRLNSKKVFNRNGHLLSNEQYTFKNIVDIKQGVSEESFNIYKKVKKLDVGSNTFLAPVYRLGTTSRIKYPSIVESVSTIQGGYTNTISYDKYDFLTGQVTESHSVSSDGQSFKTKTVPAYTIPQYNPSGGYGMGSKVDNITNKNMMSQTAANYSYINEFGNWKVTGVGITTWSNVWEYRDIAGTSTSPSADNEKIWRKHKSYVWNGVKDGNGIFYNYNSSTYDGFDWSVPVGVGVPVVQNSKWKQTSEITLYDHYSASLEMKDINCNLVSTKMGDSDTKVMATGNAGYSEMFFAGGENLTPNTTWLEPEVFVTDASQLSGIYFHTGKKSITATSSSEFGVAMKSGQHRLGKYKITVWVHKDNANKARIKDNGTIVPFTESRTAGDWVLKSGYIDIITPGAYSIYVTSVDGSTVYFDDLMIRPIASSITGYVYNEWDELSYIIGNNGLATRFEYDAAGRLVKTRSEVVDDVANGITGGFKIVKTNAYNNRFVN